MAALPATFMPLPILDLPAPQVSLAHLDDLWFQVGGTLCNLECRHCFISCSPHNHSFGFLDLETVRNVLEDVKSSEFYCPGSVVGLDVDNTQQAEIDIMRHMLKEKQ